MIYGIERSIQYLENSSFNDYTSRQENFLINMKVVSLLMRPVGCF